MLSLVGASLGIYYLLLTRLQLNIWWVTSFFLTVLALFLYGLFNLISGLLLYGEVYSELEVGTVRRWISRITAVQVLVLCTVFVLLFDFIGGMYCINRHSDTVFSDSRLPIAIEPGSCDLTHNLFAFLLPGSAYNCGHS